MPRISVLIPTRKRVDDLRKCMNSLLVNCSDINNVEVLLRLDSDDVESLEDIRKMYRTFCYPLRVSCLIGPRKNGYGSLHEFFYELYTLSTGDILMGFSDDSIMLTPGWDQVLINEYGTLGVNRLISQDTPKKEGILYFAISRDLIQLLGHFGDSVYVDTWLTCVCRGYVKDIDINIIHTRDDNDSQDITLAEANAYKKLNGFYGWKLTLFRVRDRQKFLKAKTNRKYPILFLLVSEFAEKIRVLRYLKRKVSKKVKK